MAVLGLITVQTIVTLVLRFTHLQRPLIAGLCLASVGKAQTVSSSHESCDAPARVSGEWHAPAQWPTNNLDRVIHGSGTDGIVFDPNQAPANVFNWCNMPHVHPQTYQKADSNYDLLYVEVIHRHHKRTPYEANTFPREGYEWQCDDQGLFFGGRPMNPNGNTSAATYWTVYESRSNPLAPRGFNGTCQFPQITRGGLDDSHQHGVDLKAVYQGMLGLIPAAYDPTSVSYRVTNNVITSQVASMVVAGMWPEQSDEDTPLLIQQRSIDSLEPSYSCPTAAGLRSTFGPGSSSPTWRRHLDQAAPLKARLDAVSGVEPAAQDWSSSYDHYFDNLSSRLCHAKPLPCSIEDSSHCITEADAHAVFRLGAYEYSFIYRDAGRDALRASTAEFGVWIAELAHNLREAASRDESTAETSSLRYRHNIAHDGSIARLLSILQLDHMTWPGMGAEVVFELYRRRDDGCSHVRVLWSGQVLRSSHPALGAMDMLPLGTLLAYFDGLVGQEASKVRGLCGR